MMSNVKVLAVITARGGSKGLPGKNIKLLGKKHLIGWTIDAALKANCIDKVIVSTDCPNIAKISKEYGAEIPFLRPDSLASDTATSIDTVLHAVTSIKEDFDVIILLQPTSPFRTSDDIDKSFLEFKVNQTSSVVSVCEVEKNPAWYFWRNENDTLSQVLKNDNDLSRRQDLQIAYALNGAIYIVDTKRFLSEKKFLYEDTHSYVMDKKSSIDIDDEIDFKFAQFIIGEK